MMYAAFYFFTFSAFMLAIASAMDANAFEALMTRSEQDAVAVETKNKISMNADDDGGRSLQLVDDSAQCYSTQNERQPNRYCLFEDTPREHTFLVLSCPNTEHDLSQCHCTIGVGEPEEAPNTDTCWKCAFCNDGTLAYDCRNVAEGTCIGRNCQGECVSSQNEPEDLLIESSAAMVGVSVCAYLLLVTIFN
jgi:hypothetical protein